MINEIDIMYHYCSLETFMKVLVTNRIWLSHVQTTNDALDDRMFLSSLERVVKKHKGDELFNNNLLEKMALTYAQKVDFPYIACFTRNKNLLSQWRAYGDDGKKRFPVSSSIYVVSNCQFYCSGKCQHNGN